MRCLFLLPFFQFGFLYNQKLEIKDNLNNLCYFLIIFLVQFLLICNYNNITFSLVGCNDFDSNILLPFITSLTGILFWLRISKIISSYFRGNKLIKYISQNTFEIMTHHMFIFFLINTVFRLFKRAGFDETAYRNNIFYIYLPFDYRFSIFYLLLGIFVPLIIKHLIDIIFNFIRNKKSIIKAISSNKANYL